MKKFFRQVMVLQILLVVLAAAGCSSGRRGEYSRDKVVFSFEVTADMMQFAKEE
ncbi:MAG: hypothetical protein JXD22_14215 [Sedimentisphaerales bacterium]|nr:hypothetical protein [Sedimentisphaerales bacterium]